MENFIYLALALALALALIAAGVIGERSLHFSFSRTEQKPAKRKASGKKRAAKPASAPAGKRGRPRKSEGEQAGA